MPWRVVERKIGRAGGVKQRTARQREWDRKYGEGNWAVGYVLDGELRPPGTGPGIDLLPELRGTFRRPSRGPGGTDPHGQKPAKPTRRGDHRRGPSSAGDHEVPGASWAVASGYRSRGHRLLEGQDIPRPQHPPQPAAHPGHQGSENDAGTVLAGEEVPGRLGKRMIGCPDRRFGKEWRSGA